jgi:molybdenum cofactor cytidylyltransferase
LRAVVLAAGSSSRVGRQKLLVPFRGRALIEYAIEAAASWRPVVVCGHEVAHYLHDHCGIAAILNDAPERGMSHSLSLANRAIEDDVAIGVLLADKPLVSAQLIEAVLRASRDADVTFPQRDGEPGHPVVLSVRARHFVDDLPLGDTVRLLRDRSELIAQAVETTDEGAFFDVDTIEAFES